MSQGLALGSRLFNADANDPFGAIAIHCQAHHVVDLGQSHSIA
jgi:hypothetical protein